MIGASLRYSRRRAGLTQEQLATRAGVPQASIARIEAGRVQPRADTIARLLEACGMRLEITPLSGIGIDRTAIRELLALSPLQRLQLAATEARHLERLRPIRRARRQSV